MSTRFTLDADDILTAGFLTSPNVTTLQTILGGGAAGAATDAEVTAGTVTNHYISPATLKKGAVNGVASLGSGGRIPTGQLPFGAIPRLFTVNTSVLMLALGTSQGAVAGDVALRTDDGGGRYYLLLGADPTQLGSWVRLPSAADLTASSPVQSVAGHTGNVTLSVGDISGLGSLAAKNQAVWSTDISGKPTTLSGYGIVDAVSSSALTSALATKADLTSGKVPVSQLSIFNPSGSTHAAGLVPDPGSVAGSARFLCESGAWNVPNSIYWRTVTASSSSGLRQLNRADQVLLDGSGGSFSVTLPASPTIGDELQLRDFGATLTLHPVTVLRAGGLNIDGVTDDLAMDRDAASAHLVFEGGSIGWRVQAPGASSIYLTEGGGSVTVGTTSGTVAAGDDIRILSSWRMAATIVVDGTNGSDTTGLRGTSQPVATLAHAISLAQAGDTIVVRPGSYVATNGYSAIAVNKANLSIHGYGAKFVMTSGQAYNSFLSITAAGVTLEGLEFDGGYTGSAPNNVSSISTPVVDIQGAAHNVIVRDLYIHDSQTEGIRFGGGTNVTIERCRLENLYWGIAVQPSNVAYTGLFLHQIYFKNCSSRGLQANSNTVGAFKSLYRYKELVFDSCASGNCSLENNGGLNNVTIEDIAFINCGWGSIDGSNNVSVHRTRSKNSPNCVWELVNCDGCSIYDTDVDDTDASGNPLTTSGVFSLADGTAGPPGVTNWLIDGVNVRGTGRWVLHTYNCSGPGTFRGANVTQGASAGIIPVYIQSSDNVTIADSTFDVRHQTVYEPPIVFEGGNAPKLINNRFLHLPGLQGVVWCNQSSVSGAVFVNNSCAVPSPNVYSVAQNVVITGTTFTNSVFSGNTPDNADNVHGWPNQQLRIGTTSGTAAVGNDVRIVSAWTSPATIVVDGVNGNDTTGVRGTTQSVATLGHAMTLAQAGDTIVVRPGTYAEVLTVNKSVTINASGAILQRPRSASNCIGLTIYNSACNNLIINGLTIDGNRVDGDSASYNGLVEIYNCDGVTLKKCTVKNSAGIGIRPINTVTNLTVSECLVDGCSTGINSYNDSAVAACSNVLIEKTTVQNQWPDNTANTRGIAFDLGSGSAGGKIKIQKCRVVNCGQLGIEIWSGGQNPGWLDCEVSDCYISGSFTGISIDGNQRCVVRNNRVESLGDSTGGFGGYACIEVATYCTDVEIVDNQLDASGLPNGDEQRHYGIVTSNVASQRLRYARNRITNANCAIDSNATDSVYENNVIIGARNCGIITHGQNPFVQGNWISVNSAYAGGFFGHDAAGSATTAGLYEGNFLVGSPQEFWEFYQGAGGSINGVVITGNVVIGTAVGSNGQIYNVDGANVSVFDNQGVSDYGTRAQITFPGNTYFAGGTGDGATLSTYDTKLHVHWGLGIEDVYGNVHIVVDSRSGNIITTGAFVGGLVPPQLPDGSASNGLLYYSTTAGKLAYRDASGIVNSLGVADSALFDKVLTYGGEVLVGSDGNLVTSV